MNLLAKVGSTLLALAALLAADVAAGRIVPGLEPRREVGASASGRARRLPPLLQLLPRARSFLARLEMVRADGAVFEGRFLDALQRARAALFLAPDDDAVRVRLATMLAYDLPPLESDPSRRVTWISEGLRMLDEGLERRPDDAVLHAQRGHLLRTRGAEYDAFERAFERAEGRSTLEAAGDAFAAAARWAGARSWVLRWAAIGLETRGDARLLRALRERDTTAAEGARRDFGRELAALDRLLAEGRLRPQPLELDRTYAEASVRLAKLVARRLRGEAAEEDEIARLEAVRRDVVERRRREAGP